MIQWWVEERMEPAYDPVVSGGEDGTSLWSSGEWWVGEKMEDRKQEERETVIQWCVVSREEDGRQEAGKRGRLWSSGEWCARERMEDRKQERGSRSQSMIQWWVVRRGEDRRQARGRGSQSMIQWWVVRRGEDRRQERGRGSQSMIQWWVVNRGEDGRQEADRARGRQESPAYLFAAACNPVVRVESWAILSMIWCPSTWPMLGNVDCLPSPNPVPIFPPPSPPPAVPWALGLGECGGVRGPGGWRAPEARLWERPPTESEAPATDCKRPEESSDSQIST